MGSPIQSWRISAAHGDGKTDITRRVGHSGGIHADDRARRRQHQRSARVPGRNGCGDLQHVLVVDAVNGEITIEAADDTGSHRVAKTEGASESQHIVAQRAGIGIVNVERG